MSLSIKFFGVQHFDRVSTVTEKLDEELPKDCDALFLERSPTGATTKEKFRATFLAPMLMISFYSYSVLGRAFTLAKNRKMKSADEIATKAVAERRSIPVHSVDKNIVKIISEVGAFWMLLNWMFFLALAFEISGSTGIFSAIRTGFPMLMFLFVLLFLPFIVTSAEGRNAHIIAMISEISEENDYEKVGMITGRYHLKGLKELSDLFGIENNQYSMASPQRRVKAKILKN